MRILCAPDSFKGSITAAGAADAMAAGVRDADATLEVDPCPIGDGGEGSLAVLAASMGGRLRAATVTGPSGNGVSARWGVADGGRTGLVELAQASGLGLVATADRDPMRTTSFGTGELIRRAAEAGCTRTIVLLGGSATCDGGAGIAQALGAVFRDAGGSPISTPLTGGDLPLIAAFEPPPDPPDLVAACDVRNPLFGPNGAAAVYGPQKGAKPAQVEALDAGLRHLAAVVGTDPDLPGAGAAGGAAFGLAAMLGARLRPGIDVVLDAVRFRERCRGAALVLTGEGRLDEQSLVGKAPAGVAAAAASLGVPTIAIVGSTGPGAARTVAPAAGACFAAYVSLTERYGADRARREPALLLRQAAERAVREFLGGQSRFT